MITRIIISAALCLGLSIQGLCQEDRPKAVQDSLLFEGQYRTHYLYMPTHLREGRPLVVMLHGYGGKADGYRPEMLEVAEKEGFAVCIPQGLKAPQGKTGWYVGYPKQKGMRQNDDEFICFLSRHLCETYQLENCFLTGMSNGGEMCYLIGRKYPGEFRAIASIAGLTMQWIGEHVASHGPVPFMEVHGTQDKTSLWEGDLENEGGWGAYISVPEAVQFWVNENGCPAEEKTTVLPLKTDTSRQVVLHSWTGVPAWEGGPACEVRLYEIQGGKHSWALADMDTCNIVWEFFSKYLR